MAKAGINAGANLNDGRMRAVIESITPSVDNGRFAAKRIVGDAAKPTRIGRKYY